MSVQGVTMSKLSVAGFTVGLSAAVFTVVVGGLGVSLGVGYVSAATSVSSSLILSLVDFRSDVRALYVNSREASRLLVF